MIHTCTDLTVAPKHNFSRSHLTHHFPPLCSFRAEGHRYCSLLQFPAQLNGLSHPTEGWRSWSHVCGEQRLHPLTGSSWHKSRAFDCKGIYFFYQELVKKQGVLTRVAFCGNQNVSVILRDICSTQIVNQVAHCSDIESKLKMVFRGIFYLLTSYAPLFSQLLAGWHNFHLMPTPPCYFLESFNPLFLFSGRHLP